ncbi:ras-related protein Rab5A-like [Pollicipes pollicipes]|uniref:ras-related protein Rab5A-like n=1 Tax=Pollicipes pollicipes TaxID=41117 RepID=UPI00188594F7|nr:ras-related protein Rab5A-like [Pollicipes pollicipes]
MRLVHGKMVLLGAEGVGKTSLMLRMVEKQPLSPTPTVGAAFFNFKMKIGTFLVNLQVWDTAGQERFGAMAPLYYRHANAALVVFDVTNFASFSAAQRWIDELGAVLGPDLVLVVVGNKADLRSQRAVPETMARTLAAARGAHYYETSAQHNSGVDDVFYHTALQLGQRLQECVERRKG